ncbi:MAG: hypothetical protein HUU01_17695 [Saprospiraceae bacterium]|nr:hypothetical protein [Saprospiraceae bacterium]
MKAQQDFEFSIPLTVQEALQRLQDRTKESGIPGSFYGSVQGNHFFLHQEAGAYRNETMDDPQITGYILPLAEGCRVHVRIRVPEHTEGSARFGAFALIALGGVLLLIRFSPESHEESMPQGDWIQFLFDVAIMVSMAAGGWLAWKKFEDKDRPRILGEFRALLEG